MNTRHMFLAFSFSLIILLAISFAPQWVPGVTARSVGQATDRQDITIPYPGRLTDSAGRPVADRVYDFTFTLYADEKDGDPLWKETQTGLEVRGGNFSALLGRTVPTPTEVAEKGDLWLAVAVRGPAESTFTTLDVRQRVRSQVSSPNLTSSCVHDHFDEWWVGSSSTAGLVVDNRTGTGDGIRGYSNAANDTYGGVYGINFNTGPGVYGRSDGGGPGVAGYSSGRGVYGLGADGVVGESYTDYKSGVYGYNIEATTGYGVTGRSNSYFGVFAWGNDGNLFDNAGDILLQGNGEVFAEGHMNLFSNGDIYADLDNDNNSSGACFVILDGADNTLWSVCETTGTQSWVPQSSVVQTSDNGQRLLYGVESTGVWVEDMGTATLAEGELTVTFDPVYVQTVNLQQDYRVFVTALSDEPVLLYVSSKTPTSFTVRGATLDGKPANCSFDYRVVAQRLGYEGTRLPVQAPTTKGERQP